MTPEEIQAAIKKAVADELTTATKTLTDSVGKLIADSIKPLADNQKVLADTLAQLPPAGEGKASTKAADKKEGASGAAEPLTMDAVTAGVVKLLDERDAKRQTSAAKTAARQKVIDAKLKDVPVEFHASLPDSDNEAELLAAADKIVGRVNEVLKVRASDLGGAGKGGGTTPAAAAAAAGGAKKGFLVMPGQAA